MKFSKEHDCSYDSSIWKDRVKQETNSFFHSINEGIKSHKVLPQDLKTLSQPNLNTIRTRSYVNIEDFYEKGILQSSVPQLQGEISSRRYNNYPWAKPTLLLDHDSQVKNVKSPKLIIAHKRMLSEWQRQQKSSKDLFCGLSSGRLHLRNKLPPLTHRKK